ncbi:hypothetical protein D3C86_1815450 [compost metagenome]
MINSNARIRPNSPNMPESIIIGKRRIRKEIPAEYCGIINEEMPVMATTMTMGADTNPA